MENQIEQTEQTEQTAGEGIPGINAPLLDPRIGEEVAALARRRRSHVADVGVALPETFGRVVIAEVDSPFRSFMIPVSLDQAAMIATTLKSLARKRPLLSDVLVDVLNQFSMAIAMVSITGRQGDVFLAELSVVDAQGRQRNMPIRPSDAILVALSAPVTPPIMVDDSLFGPVPEI